MSQNFTLSFFALKFSLLFCFFASFSFSYTFSHRSEKNFASVSLHFASKRKLRQFRFFFVSFLLCFIFVSLQISTFRIDAKQVKNPFFSHRSEKNFASVSLHFASKRKWRRTLLLTKKQLNPSDYSAATLYPIVKNVTFLWLIFMIMIIISRKVIFPEEVKS